MRTMVILTMLSVTCWNEVPPVQQPRQVIIFHDISRSVADDEEKSGQTTVDTIIDQAPADTELVVVPICANTAQAPERRLKLKQGFTPDDKKKEQDKRNAFKQEVRDQVKALRPTPAGSASCISPALRRVRSEIRSSKSEGGADVIFVSDMIEECEVSLLGQPTSLRGRQFTGANALVNGNGALVTLPPNTRIFVMRPRAISTAGSDPHAPRDEQLQAFWERLFGRCGVPQAQIYWDAAVSHYVTSL